MFDRRQPTFRWSAVLAGAACSIGLWMLLQVLGTGIGLAAIDVDDAGSLRGVGIGTTVWSLIAPLIAMFCGGLLTGRLTQTYERKLGGAHAVVMWAITSVIGLCVTVWIMTMLASSVARAGGAAAHVAGRAISTTADRVEPGRAMDALGLDADDLLAPINQRLTAQGKPAITAAQLQRATRGAARDAARGDLDRDRLIDQLAANTQLSREDARDVADQLEARWNAVGDRARDLGARAEHYALDAADATGKVLATVGLSLLLSLIAAVAGAMIAMRRVGRRDSGGGGGTRRTGVTEPGYVVPDAPAIHTTAPYPPATPRDGSLP